MPDFQLWNGINPRLIRCRRMTAALPDLPERTLLHAGPPFSVPANAPRPVRNAAVSAICAEGWADCSGMAEAMVQAGDITLVPAQDHGVVTPLAFVVSPSMPLLQVEVAGAVRYAPVNDGPPEGALRFGMAAPKAQVARIARMQELCAPLDQALIAAGGIDLLPMMALAIAAGDDLHGSVVAMTNALANRLTLQNGWMADFVRTPLFALNPVMAAAAAMLGGVGSRHTGPMVIAAGGNGVEFGWISSQTPGKWHTLPAQPPVGPRMQGKEGPEVLPAIGDSAVIDALGLGGAILRYAPLLTKALAPFHSAETFTTVSSAAFLARHPTLPADIRLGLPTAAMARHPGIMLAMLGSEGEGLLGRGLAPWPV